MSKEKRVTTVQRGPCLYLLALVAEAGEETMGPFEKGQIWETRGGEKSMRSQVTITDVTAVGDYPVRGLFPETKVEHVWTRNGLYKKGEPSPLDLVNCLVDVEVENPPRPKIEVGQVWATRGTNGVADLVTIEALDGHNPIYPIVGRFHSNKTAQYWTKGGKFDIDAVDSPEDLARLDTAAPLKKGRGFPVSEALKKPTAAEYLARLETIEDAIVSMQKVVAAIQVTANASLEIQTVLHSFFSNAVTVDVNVLSEAEEQPQRHRFQIGQVWTNSADEIWLLTDYTPDLPNQNANYPLVGRRMQWVEGSFWSKLQAAEFKVGFTILTTRFNLEGQMIGKLNPVKFALRNKMADRLASDGRLMYLDKDGNERGL